eukprot:1138482-Pelagomonas_calceolata.AAC.3
MHAAGPGLRRLFFSFLKRTRHLPPTQCPSTAMCVHRQCPTTMCGIPMAAGTSECCPQFPHNCYSEMRDINFVWELQRRKSLKFLESYLSHMESKHHEELKAWATGANAAWVVVPLVGLALIY